MRYLVKDIDGRVSYADHPRAAAVRALPHRDRDVDVAHDHLESGKSMIVTGYSGNTLAFASPVPEAVPERWTDYDRNDAELEAMLIFSVLVAGKMSKVVAPKAQGVVEDLIAEGEHHRPLVAAGKLVAKDGEETISRILRKHRTGQYKRFSTFLFTIGSYFFYGSPPKEKSLSKLSVDQLEMFPSVGPKTARMFVLHSRPDQRVAVLDTHVLRFLREKGIKAPLSTPASGAAYRRLEEEFLRIADEEGIDPAKFDFTIWSERAYH